MKTLFPALLLSLSLSAIAESKQVPCASGVETTTVSGGSGNGTLDQMDVTHRPAQLETDACLTTIKAVYPGRQAADMYNRVQEIVR